MYNKHGQRINIDMSKRLLMEKREQDKYEAEVCNPMKRITKNLIKLYIKEDNRCYY